MKKNQSIESSLWEIKILLCLIGITLLILIIITSILLNNSKNLTIQQAINDINKKEEKNYTIDDIYWVYNNSPQIKETYKISNKIWFITIYDKKGNANKSFIDNNHNVKYEV